MSVRALVTALLAGVALLGSVPASAAASEVVDPTSAAAQQLAQRYAPDIVVRRYDSLCADDGEPFVPMTVDAVLGNPEVALRQVGNGDPVIKWAPTAKDLYQRGEGVYLDLPGDSLQPGCIFASDSARYNPGGRSAVYAHVTAESGKPGYLAVQYWLYWYYNDWNDKHESDWEFVQVLFHASSVDEALSEDPSSVGYAQHTGGEVSAWTSDKLERDGTHPVVYSSQRSHASYVEPALFLGRGASEGFGCDNTQAPSTSLRPTVVLLPDKPTGADDPFAWLDFHGRWGERQASPNDGPTGPSSKPRWTEPVSWQDDLRDSSFVVPGGSAAAPVVIETFCDVVGKGSVIFIDFVSSPGKVLVVFAAIVLLLSFLLRRTSWRLVDGLPVVARRRAGEIVRAAVHLYRARSVTFAALGLIALPVVVVAVLVSALLPYLPWIGDAVEVSESGGPGSRALLSSVVAAAFWPVTLTLVTAAVAFVTGADQRISAQDGVRTVWHRIPDLASSFVPAVVVIFALALTVVGAPIAAWLTVRLQFLPQVTMLEGARGRRALARSSALVRGRWIHTAVISGIVWSAVAGVSLLVALLLLVAFTGLPLWSITLSMVLCQVALVPLGALVMTLLYGDASAEHETRTAADRSGPLVPA
jgi:hypothetical protein